MVDRIARMRAKQGLMPPEPVASTTTTEMPESAEPTAPPSAEPAPVNPKKEARKAALEAGPKITYQCGHAEPLKLVTNHPCPGCRNKMRQDKALRKRVAREAKKVERGDSGQRGRLPDGSRFYIDPYDATSGSWSGTLIVTGYPPFAGTASGLWKLLRALDQQYREAVAHGG